MIFFVLGFLCGILVSLLLLVLDLRGASAVPHLEQYVRKTIHKEQKGVIFSKESALEKMLRQAKEEGRELNFSELSDV